VRLTVERDGRTVPVEVADDLASVRVGDNSYPVKVVARGPMRVELEVGGEAVVVDGWPDRHATPPGPVDVNGERWPVSVRAEAGRGVAATPASAAAPPGAAAVPPGGPGVPGPAGSTAVLPPMPGRVVEVRVREGDVVAKGAVVLVLEAMKMRSEVTAPVDGVVTDLRVREGTNVRAREPLLFLVPK